MKYAILINCSPETSDASRVAYRFSVAVLQKGHRILQIFFYREGIHNALRYALPPESQTPAAEQWSQLAAEHGIDLVVCISAAQRRGLLHADEAQRRGACDDNLAPGFRIAGLGQWLQASMEADRHLVFG